MINYFNKLLTGYYTAKRRVNGMDLRYSYTEKPIFFDPIGMLKEFRPRVSDLSVQRLMMRDSFSEPLEDIGFPEVGLKPSVICQCSKNGTDLKVSRFSIRDGVYPMSFYKFKVGGKLIGTFRRKYDYGSQIQKVGLKLASQTSTEIDLSKDKWLWENDLGQQLFLEKFVHTQMWFFSSPEVSKLLG
jgi:hypothetical protein